MTKRNPPETIGKLLRPVTWQKSSCETSGDPRLVDKTNSHLQKKTGNSPKQPSRSCTRCLKSADGNAILYGISDMHEGMNGDMNVVLLFCACLCIYFVVFVFFLSMERRKKGEEERRRKERIDSLEKWRKWWDILTFSRETQMQTFPVSWQGRERVCRVTSHGFGFKPFGFCDRHIWENLSSSSPSAPSCFVSKIEFSPATATFQLSMHTRGRKSPSSSSWSPVPVSSSVMPSSSDTRPYPDWGETTHR